MLENPQYFEPDALHAAETVLKEREENNQYEIDQPLIHDSQHKTPLGDLIFNIRPFFRSLSYREFLTYFALSLFWLAVTQVLTFYNSEPFVETYSYNIQIATFIFLFLLGHIIYRLEHRRPNIFFTRVISDLFLLLFIYTVILFNRFLTGYFETGIYSFGDTLSFLLALFIVIFFFEGVVALVKLILRMFRCEIL